jgi:hypothetical protein
VVEVWNDGIIIGAPISTNFHCARRAAPCDLRSRPGARPEEGDE